MLQIILLVATTQSGRRLLICAWTASANWLTIVAVGGGTGSGLGSLLLETEDELKFMAEAKKGQKVDKEGSGWTAGGIEHQDGAGRPCVWSPVTGEGGTRTHAPVRGRQAAAGKPRV